MIQLTRKCLFVDIFSLINPTNGLHFVSFSALILIPEEIPTVDFRRDKRSL